jgi:hypothetical protein
MSGCDSGDSSTGSIGSSGLIRCARMHIFGSDTSSTDNALGLYDGSLTSGDTEGSCEEREKRKLHDLSKYI